MEPGLVSPITRKHKTLPLDLRPQKYPHKFFSFLPSYFSWLFLLQVWSSRRNYFASSSWLLQGKTNVEHATVWYQDTSWSIHATTSQIYSLQNLSVQICQKQIKQPQQVEVKWKPPALPSGIQDVQCMVESFVIGKLTGLVVASLLVKIRSLVARNWLLNFVLTYREGNQVADGLAKKGSVDDLSFTAYDACPSNLYHVLLADTIDTCFVRNCWLVPVLVLCFCILKHQK